MQTTQMAAASADSKPGRPAARRRMMGSLGVWALVCGIGFGSGCSAIPKLQEDRTQFFTLTAATTPGTVRANAPRILVRRVELPAYLQPKTIAIRHDGAETRYIDTAWWSEPLDLAIGRVLRDRLNQLGVPAVARRDEGFDYELVVRVTRFEGEVDGRGNGSATLRATYELERVGSGNPPIRQIFASDPVPWNGRNYADLAKKLGAAVAALADVVQSELPPR